MKALSIKQPWASVICTGLKDVENRSWRPAQIPGRFLIHASSAKVPRNFEDVPSELISNIKNGRLMGQFPEYKDMPVSAIIGYVDCYKIVQDSDSIWAQAGAYHWCLRNARFFDTPIMGVKGAQGRLFDVPAINENNLPPSHEWICEFPDAVGDTLILPVSDAVLAEIEAGSDNVTYDFTDTLYNLLFDPEKGEPIKYKIVQFIGKDKVITKQFDGIDNAPYVVEGGKTVELIEFPGQGIYWAYVSVYFK